MSDSQGIPASTDMKVPTPPDVRRHARLSLKLDRRPTGDVDGAWWPRSWDLVEELPELIADLRERIGSVSRVSYSLVTWPAVPRRALIGGCIVRLGGFFSVPAELVDLFGSGGRVCLLVVPPDIASARGRTVLERAAASGSTESVETLLRPGVRPVPDAGRASSVNRWETDGGRHWPQPSCGSATD